MFLLRELLRLPEEDAYDFFAWKFGPFSPEILDDLEELEAAGAVARQGRGNRATYPPTLELADKARDLARKIANPKTLALIEVIRHRLANMEFRQTVAAIYSEYPDWSEKTELPEYRPDGPNKATWPVDQAFSRVDLDLSAEILVNRRRGGDQPPVSLADLHQQRSA